MSPELTEKEKDAFFRFYNRVKQLYPHIVIEFHKRKGKAEMVVVRTYEVPTT